MDAATLTKCSKSSIVLHLIIKDENKNVSSLTKCYSSSIVLHLITKMKTWILLLSTNATGF